MTPLGASLGRSLLTLALVAMVVLGVYQGLWQWWGDPQAPSVWQGLWSADGALAAAGRRRYGRRRSTLNSGQTRQAAGRSRR